MQFSNSRTVATRLYSITGDDAIFAMRMTKIVDVTLFLLSMKDRFFLVQNTDRFLKHKQCAEEAEVEEGHLEVTVAATTTKRDDIRVFKFNEKWFQPYA